MPNNPNRIPDDVIKDLKSEANIVDIINQNQRLNVRGNKYNGVCPVCKKENMVVYPDTQSFYCFSCGLGGDVFSYVKSAFSMDYIESLNYIADSIKYKLPIERDDGDKLLKDVALFYHFQLRSSKKAAEAIKVLHSWGISGKTIVNLGIGFHDDDFNCCKNHILNEKNYTLEAMIDSGLVAKAKTGQYYDKMRNSIIVPTIGTDGFIKRFDYYNLEKKSWYKTSCAADFKRSDNFYSLNISMKSKKQSVVIVSSFEDYFYLIGQGITNVVSTYLPNITEEQLELLKKYYKVIIPVVPKYVNFSLCYKYCKSKRNKLYYDDLDLIDCETPKEYFEKYGLEKLIGKINEYERAFS